ncbi:MFS transporter [Nocardioides panacisoli]|uniref:MFS transporter n=1 Tax=Nocardioides panacisoli TaxID=627624 RepID=A0ABP7IV13_9ACTN
MTAARAPQPARPELLGTPPPPVRRDPMVLTWVAAVAISTFGDAVWTVALAWTAAHLLPPAVAGAVIGIEMLPQAALVLFGGVVADRWDPRKVLVAGQVARATVLVVGALAWRAGLDGAPTLFAVALCFGAAAGLTTPSGSALVRQVVDPDDFRTVLGWNQVLSRVTRLLGAPVGGVLVATGGPVAAMLLDAATFAVIALVLGIVVEARFALPRAAQLRWRDSFADGVDYLRRSPTARVFVTGLTALNVFVSPVIALGLALRVDGAGWGPHWLGIADGALAAGAIVGSMAAIRWQPLHSARVGFQVLVLQGVGLAVVGVASLPVVLAGMATVGATAGLASVWLSAAFLRAVDPTYTGRVSSVTSLGDLTLMPLSMPVLGALAGASSVLTATAAFGLSMSALCVLFATRRSIAALV